MWIEKKLLVNASVKTFQKKLIGIIWSRVLLWNYPISNSPYQIVTPSTPHPHDTQVMLTKLILTDFLFVFIQLPSICETILFILYWNWCFLQSGSNARCQVEEFGTVCSRSQPLENVYQPPTRSLRMRQLLQFKSYNWQKKNVHLI